MIRYPAPDRPDERAVMDKFAYDIGESRVVGEVEAGVDDSKTMGSHSVDEVKEICGCTVREKNKAKTQNARILSACEAARL